MPVRTSSSWPTGWAGHAAGDVASSLIVGQLAPLDGESIGAEQALPALEKSVRDANSSLRRAMEDDPELRGMGSTTIAMLRTGNKLAMAHIGDSRAYLLRDGTLSQITKDHSFVQQLVDEGRITPEEAEDHPQRSLVTRVMTGQVDDEPDLSMRELRAGDRYLLCSDGLCDFVRRDIIEEILSESPTPERCRGPADRGRPQGQRPRQRDRRRRRRRRPARLRGAQHLPADRRGGVAARPRGQAHPGPADQPRREGRQPGPLGARAVRGRRRQPACWPRSRAPRAVIWVRRVVLAVALAADPRRRRVRGLGLDPEPVLRQVLRRLRRHLAGRRPEHRARSACPASTL